MDITISLTEAEAKALAYVAADPYEWASNVIKERARIAMEDIFTSEMQKMLADPAITSIPADRESVVLAANILSAAETAAASEVLS